MTQTNNILQDIAALLLEHSPEMREDILHEELDRVTIYRSNCWAILCEIQHSTFELADLGTTAKTPEELTWWLLYQRFITEYGILLTE